MAYVLLLVPVHLRRAGVERSAGPPKPEAWSAKCVLGICRSDISTGRPYSKSRTWSKAARSRRDADRAERLGRSCLPDCTSPSIRGSLVESAARPELHLLPVLCSSHSWNLLLCEL